MSNSTKDLISFEPESWNGLNQHQKVKSIFWDSHVPFDKCDEAQYLDTGDDDTDLLLRKIRAAKFAYKCVSKKMADDDRNSKPGIYDSDYVSGSDEDSRESSYAYNDDHLLKFASALRFDYTFEMCFKIRSDTNKEFESCICPCTSFNTKWRELFQIDLIGVQDECKKKESKIEAMLSHLQSKHRRGHCYLHSVSYLYIVKLYSHIIPRRFTDDLPDNTEPDD